MAGLGGRCAPEAYVAGAPRYLTGSKVARPRTHPRCVFGLRRGGAAPPKLDKKERGLYQSAFTKINGLSVVARLSQELFMAELW